MRDVNFDRRYASRPRSVVEKVKEQTDLEHLTTFQEYWEP